MGHSKGTVKGKFCAKRTEKCRDGQEYRKNCSPSPKKWQNEFFRQGRRKKPKFFEAHHLLCVASVTKCIAGGKGIKEIVKNTEWCVNRKKNMFAMPLWGHTIQHYCKIEERGLNILERVDKKSVGAPKFKNIPHHDYDHNSNDGYKDELEGKLDAIAKDLREMKDKAHEAKTKELQSRLNKLSGDCRTLLQRRGERKDGTNEAWKKGKNGKDAEWYEPFSMAATGNVSERAFPSADVGGTLADKIKALVKAFKGE